MRTHLKRGEFHDHNGKAYQLICCRQDAVGVDVPSTNTASEVTCKRCRKSAPCYSGRYRQGAVGSSREE